MDTHGVSCGSGLPLWLHAQCASQDFDEKRSASLRCRDSGRAENALPRSRDASGFSLQLQSCPSRPRTAGRPIAPGVAPALSLAQAETGVGCTSEVRLLGSFHLIWKAIGMRCSAGAIKFSPCPYWLPSTRFWDWNHNSARAMPAKRSCTAFVASSINGMKMKT
ncbi:uncharacterized protein IWZ02DRAFT_87795 [Phyllosticta citriasiana]|uniref:Uncharacterized protein n=1 Tax=Phyllosticta citriasiana TaxID=595635 RepID=A0ABR1L060_9PEZI